MRKKFFLLISFLFSFYPGWGQGRAITLKHITSEEGLSDNQVTCILRDKRGFMWFGTKDGLSRYDGRDFYVFRHQVNDSSSLCSNNITCLADDSDSILWIGTASSGFCSYDFRTQKFATYNKNNIALLSNSINAIRFDASRNVLWLALNNGGLQLFSLEEKNFLPKYTFIAARSFYDVLLKDSLAFVAGIVQSIRKVNPPFKPDTSKSAYQPARTINKMIAGSDGNIWCGAWDNMLHEFNVDAKLLHSYIFDGTNKPNFSTDEIISIAEDGNRILWCGTKSSGLHFFDLKSKSFTNAYPSQPISSRIHCIYRDDYNRMWMGTEEGLYFYDPLQNQFEVTALPVPDESINCKVYDRVVAKNGSEYIVAACGLFYKNGYETEYHFKVFDYRNEKLQLTSIFRDENEMIFIGSNKTIFILDTEKIELKTIPVNPELLSKPFFSIYSSRVNSISSIKSDGRNLIAMSFYGHYLTLTDLNRKNIFWLYCSPTDQQIENLTRKIFVDSKHRIWICGASRGISEFLLPMNFHPDSFPPSNPLYPKIIIRSKNWKNVSGTDSTLLNDVYDIIENEDDGSFWMTSEGSGLTRFFPDNTQTPFSFVKGEYQSLQGIAKQDENNLWIITSKGLLNYNAANGGYRLFDSKQGVPRGIGGYFFNDIDTVLSAGFEGGFVSFNPQRILKDTEKPQVHVTKLWVMDEASDSLLLNKLAFRYNRNFLKFYLSSNSFSNNEQVIYLYQLTGIDDDWRTNENNPFITYTNLPPGNYELKFKAINSDGMESDTRSLAVVITPPFYKTIYFYLAVAITIVMGAYAFYKYRIRQILKLQEVRNKIARDLHDDIGSTIGSINLYSQVANLKLDGIENGDVKSILDKIELSSREVIDKTGDAVWAANPANDSLKNLLLRVEGYAASVLGAADIGFKIICDEKLLHTSLKMAERKNLFLIYKEAIHNIIKYAEASEVTISVTRREGRLQMIVADNGKGFIANGKAYNGNGIKNMRARVESMNGTFTISSGENKGTAVEIII